MTTDCCGALVSNFIQRFATILTRYLGPNPGASRKPRLKTRSRSTLFSSSRPPSSPCASRGIPFTILGAGSPHVLNAGLLGIVDLSTNLFSLETCTQSFFFFEPYIGSTTLFNALICLTILKGPSYRNNSFAARPFFQRGRKTSTTSTTL